MNEKSAYQRASTHFHPIIENGIILLIILVVIHTALEDFALLLDFSQESLNQLILISFVFDSIFTIEFISRSFISVRRGDFALYFGEHRGWVDFLTSVPLLLLVSGPAVYLIYFGAELESSTLGFLSVLKTAKAIRVTRILRLIRIIKIFGKIQNADSAMTSRHLGIIATSSVLTLVLVLALTQFIPILQIGDHQQFLKARTGELNGMIRVAERTNTIYEFPQILAASASFADLLELRNEKDEIIFQNVSFNERKATAFNNGKPISLESGYKAVLSFHLLDRDHAKLNLVIFFAIVLIVLSLLFLYSRTFAQQISDPAYVMAKGMQFSDYNLEVKIPENYKDDEIFRLAQYYNEKWLPLKSRILAIKSRKTEEKSALSMDDLLG